MKVFNKLKGVGVKNTVYHWLRRSESFFKTDMVYLAKGGFWLTAGQIAASISSFSLSIAFAYFLPKETYGAYKYVLSMISLLSIATLPGINTSILQSVAQKYEGSIIPGFKARVCWGLLGGVGSLGIGLYYLFNGNETLSISFIIISLFLPFTDSFTIYQSVLQGRGLFKKESKYKALASILLLLTMVPLLWITNNLIIILLTYFTFWFTINYIFFWLTRKTILNSNQSSDSIAYGKHLTAFGVLGEIASQIDKILLFHFLGGTGTAIYSIAAAPTQQLRGLTKLIQLLIIPKASIVEIEIIKKNYWRKFLVLFAALTGITFSYIMISPVFFKVFFPAYTEAVFLSQIFSLSLIGSVGVLNVSLLQSHKQKKALYKQSIVIATFQIVSLTLGIIYAGVIGAALAFILSRFMHAIYSSIQVHQLFATNRKI